MALRESDGREPTNLPARRRTTGVTEIPEEKTGGLCGMKGFWDQTGRKE